MNEMVKAPTTRYSYISRCFNYLKKRYYFFIFRLGHIEWYWYTLSAVRGMQIFTAFSLLPWCLVLQALSTVLCKKLQNRGCKLSTCSGGSTHIHAYSRSLGQNRSHSSERGCSKQRIWESGPLALPPPRGNEKPTQVPFPYKVSRTACRRRHLSKPILSRVKTYASGQAKKKLTLLFTTKYT